mmetsp:Transcript_10281/g.29326  ORF Transcript_10281/g.29326 Transcript_10281/m.29326 type:complete len:532 (+) Transcript_10281:123-1718(+)
MKLTFHPRLFDAAILLHLASVVSSDEMKTIVDRFDKAQPRDFVFNAQSLRHGQHEFRADDEAAAANHLAVPDAARSNHHRHRKIRRGGGNQMAIEGGNRKLERRTKKGGKKNENKPTKSTKKSDISVGDGVCNLSGASPEELFKSLVALGSVSRAQALDIVYAASDLSDDATKAAIGKLVDDEQLCFTGKAGKVTSDCGDECCIGVDSCDWVGTAKVCVGSCLGADSCSKIEERATIYPLSCVGDEACQFLGRDGDSAPAGQTLADPVRVGPKACRGKDACQEFGKGDATSIDIGYAACIGLESCENLGTSASGAIKIGDYACDSEGYEGACFDIDATDSIDIGDRSCRGDQACEELGQSGPEFVAIGDDSCDGYQACEDVGEDIEDGSITIGDRSCVDYYACLEVGFYMETGTIDIGSDACVGEDSCLYVGGEEDCDGSGPNAITIGDNACAKIDACIDFGFNVGGNGIVSIAANACSDEDDQCGTKGDNANPDCDASGCAAGESFIMPLNANGPEVCSTASTCAPTPAP